MGYDQRPNQARTDTTRHLNPNERENGPRSILEYLEGARHRSARFAETTGQLREIHAEIDSLGREAHNRPTGMLSGGDVDIAYHYLGVGIGVLALLYSVLGSIFIFHGGSEAVLTPFLERWATGPAAAVTDILLNTRTLMAVILQAVLFVVLIGTRRSMHTWQHLAALMASVALTYAGWSSILVIFASNPLASFTATIPAAVVGGAFAWAIIRASSDILLPRSLMIGLIVVGVVAGGLGVTTLIHWMGLLLAWSADQVARRIMIVG